jgi:hypothetical protein
MDSLIERVRTRIHDPRLTTSMNVFSPRQHDLYPPVKMAVVEAAETKMGFRLPPLLRELFTQVANGGFGPGYGIFGLEGGYTDPLIIELTRDPDTIGNTQGGTLIDWYHTFRGVDDSIPELDYEFEDMGKSKLFIDPEPRPDTWRWFDKLVPISNNGCWQIFCIDCSRPAFPLWFYEGQQCELQLECRSFNEWIENWLRSS